MAKQKPSGGGGSPQNLMRQVQKMQEDMAAAQEALAAETVEASAGGGVVKAVVTGTGELRSVVIDAAVVDPDDVEMLQDLVVAAVNEGMRASQQLQAEKMGSVTGDIDLGGLSGLLG
jgi:DNA-binding YbaB/EbfC family protein